MASNTTKRTFHPVPLGFRSSVPGLYAFHAEHSPNHPVFTYADLESNELHDITYADAWRDIRRTAATISAHCDRADSVASVEGSQKRQIIGILALSDTLSYIYLMLAIMSLGHVAFPLSPRNTPIVTAYLFETVKVTHVFVSEDSTMHALSQEANSLLVGRGIQAVKLIPMVNVMSLDNSILEEALETGINEIADTDVTVILHSSGSSAYPKPIPFTKRELANTAKTPQFGETDLTGKRVAAHTNPIFHVMGLATILWPVTCGAIFALYKPVSPPVPPTPSNFLENLIASKCNIVACVPVFLEAWARDPRNLPPLRALDCVVFSGATINKAIGDALAQECVVLHALWGSTEVGPASMSVPKEAPPTYEWDYFKLSKHIKFYMMPQENMDRIYEPIVIPSDTCSPSVFNSELDGKPVYAIGDLLEQHPTDPDRWRVFGRKDDQFTLSTGENVIPWQAETTLLRDENIAAALLFGQGHYYVGVLVTPAIDITMSPGNKERQTAYIELIWPIIEKVNAAAPEHAHIDRKRIILTSPLKPLVYTPKGTPRRAVCLSLYAAEIEEVYQDERQASLASEHQFHDRI